MKIGMIGAGRVRQAIARQCFGDGTTFISGDEADAKEKVRTLIASFGFAVIDLGDLQTGGQMQQAGHPLGGPDFLIAE
jgi:predicted dinucleotide-binding enzyme